MYIKNRISLDRGSALSIASFYYILDFLSSIAPSQFQPFFSKNHTYNIQDALLHHRLSPPRRHSSPINRRLPQMRRKNPNQINKINKLTTPPECRPRHHRPINLHHLHRQNLPRMLLRQQIRPRNPNNLNRPRLRRSRPKHHLVNPLPQRS